MVEQFNLTSFVDRHERKLRAKVDAAAHGRRLSLHRRTSLEGGFLEPLGGAVYNAVLEQPIAAPSDERSGLDNMRYILTARHPERELFDEEDDE